MSKLGKGINALLNEEHDDSTAVHLIDITEITYNPYQPRKALNQEKLHDLADSISEHGILQPVVVRRCANDRYELIAGHRRLTAAQLVGLEKVPAILRNANALDMLQLAIIENIQREDLNAVDEAKAYQKLSNEFQLTHEQIASAVGKSRTTITNFLRLLKLPSTVLEMIEKEELSSGHARVVLQLPIDLQCEFAEFIVLHKLSVHEAERLVKTFTGKAKRPREIKKDIHLQAVEQKLGHRFGTKIRIQGMKKGKVELYFYSESDLKKLLSQLMSE